MSMIMLNKNDCACRSLESSWKRDSDAWMNKYNDLKKRYADLDNDMKEALHDITTRYHTLLRNLRELLGSANGRNYGK